MIIVCDTNVLISGLIFPGGAPEKIIRSILSGYFQHALSPDILTEFKRVLVKKIGLSPESTEEFIRLIKDVSELVYPAERLDVIKEDPTDNRILECALTVKAQFIVSGDKKHLLPLKSFKDISIVSPREFILLQKII